jgi:hypothetical protein
MKATALTLGAVILAVIAATVVRGDASETRSEVLTTSKGQIVDARGRPVTLRGFNVIPVWPESPGRSWGAHEYRRIARGGFNTVRFFLHWRTLQPRRGRFDRRHLHTLDRAIARADAAGLKVVLVPIGLFGGELYVPGWARQGHPLTAVEREGVPYVRRLAERYADVDAVVAFDPVNEPPSYPPDHARILALYQRLFAAIRAEAPDKLLMFEPAYGDASMVGVDLAILGDTRNIVFSLHDYYAGGPGTGYAPTGERLGAAAGARVTGLGGKADPSPDPVAMDAHLRVNLDVMRAAGIPVWVGEFGVDLSVPNARRLIRQKVELYERHGVGYAWWLYDHRSNTAPVDAASRRFKPFVRDLAGAR